ncbi:MAG: hypothetical protein R3236_07610 [Phycisphaeraceae bacterium]|nr:hypothetical protein [Phycisphaeraceae bacterium]
MAKGQHLSRYQKGIVKRYYEHFDAAQAQKLGQIVSDLYLCDSEKKAARMWAQADKALRTLSKDTSRIDKLVSEKNLEALAKMVNEVAVEPGKR